MKKKKINKGFIQGMLGNDVFINRGDLTGDANNMNLATGLYGINKANFPNIDNLPSGESYGLLLVFDGKLLGTGGAPIMQLFLNATNARLYVRSKWQAQGQFISWKRLSVDL